FRGVASSPDGRWIGTGNASDLVIWDAAAGTAEFRLTDRGNRDYPVLSLAFSPDSLQIIAGYGEYVRGTGSRTRPRTGLALESPPQLTPPPATRFDPRSALPQTWGRRSAAGSALSARSRRSCTGLPAARVSRATRRSR